MSENSKNCDDDDDDGDNISDVINQRSCPLNLYECRDQQVKVKNIL